MKTTNLFKSLFLSVILVASCATLALADEGDKARVMRVTLQDGTIKQFLVEYVQTITFNPDKNDQGGMEDPQPEDNVSDLPDNITVTTQMLFGAVTITEDRSEATMNGSYNQSMPMFFSEDIEVGSVTFDRTFNTNLTDNRYSTIMLPFSIDLAKVSGAKFYDLSIETDPVLIKGTLKNSGTLDAYKPYLIQATEEHITFDGPVVFKKHTINSITNGYWEFRGSYSYIMFKDSTDLLGRLWGYSAKNSGELSAGQFAMIGENAYIYPLRAYLVYNYRSPNPSPSVSRMPGETAGREAFPETIDIEIVENGTTGIVGQFKAMDPYHIDNWFDLQGRRVNGSPKVQGNYYNKATRKTVK